MAYGRFLFFFKQSETGNSIEKRLIDYTNGSVTWIIPGIKLLR